MAERWTIRLFGGVRVDGPGILTPRFETHRSAKLLVLLVLAKDGRMHRERLADLLWPDDFYDVTRLRLRQELSRLRRTLGTAAHLVSTDNDWVTVDRSQLVSDLDLVRRAVTLSTEPPARDNVLAEAASLCQESFLPGWDDDWVVGERASAEAWQVRCLVSYGVALASQGRYAEALEMTEASLRVHPDDRAGQELAGMVRGEIGKPASQFRLDQTTEARSDTGPSCFPLPPAAIDRFYGRTKELEELLRKLDPTGDQRLITLTGPGGIGKTRLTLETLSRLSEAYEGRIGFVGYAEVREEEDLAIATLRQLGQQVTATADPETLLLRCLPKEPTLVVLDNLEHLHNKASNLALQLLGAYPHLRILATSRQPLRVAGETAVPLGSLGEEALEMLFDLGRSVRPSLEEESDLNAVAKRLDGIPLAIRLAASRLRLLSPAEMLEQLESRFDVLKTTAPDLPARHRSLRSTVEWSVQSLPEAEQSALVSVSPFRGQWTLEQARNLLPGQDALSLMESLTDASLVYVNDQQNPIRFGMLDTVREYMAQETPEAWKAARKRYVDCLAQELSAKIPTPLAPMSVKLVLSLDADADNYLGAMEIAADEGIYDAAFALLSRFWVYEIARGRHRETERRHRQHGELITKAPPSLRGDIELGTGIACLGLSHEIEAQVHFERAIDCYRADQRLDLLSVAEASRSSNQRRLAAGSLDKALEEFPPILALAHESCSDAALARVEAHYGSLLYYKGRVQESVALFRSAHAAAMLVGDDLVRCGCAQMQAYAAHELGLQEEAESALQEVAHLVSRLGDPVRRAFQREVEGRVALATDRPEDALSAFLDSHSVWKSIDNTYQVADQANSIARAMLILGRPREASAYIKDAYANWKLVGDTGGVAVALHTLAAMQIAEGRLEAGKESIEIAMGLEAEHRLVFVATEHLFRKRVIEQLPADLTPVAKASVEDADRLLGAF